MEITTTTTTRLEYEKRIAACSKELIIGKHNALINALKQLNIASGANRAYIFKNYIDNEGNLCTQQTHALFDYGHLQDNFQPYQKPIVFDHEAPHWKKILESGEGLIEDISTAGTPERSIMERYGSVSLLLIPILTGDHWHGMMGFDDDEGETRWNELDKSFLKTAAGMVGSYVEKEFYISALIKSEERYRSIIENINEGYFELDLEGRFTFVNRKLCRMHRRTRREFIGMHYRETADADTGLLMKKTFETIYKTGIPHGIDEYKIIRKDGSIAIHENSVSLIEGDQGNKKGFRGIVRDVGEKKEQDAIRKKFHDNWFQVQKLESIATLAGGLAHDFNNLLMGIQGNTSLIMIKYNSDSFLEEKIKNIEKCVQSGSEITKQLLGFARGGKYEVKDLNLNAVVSEALKLFGRTRKDIRIHTDFTTGLNRIQGDSGQLGQIFLNLFLNAGQAMPDGGQLYIVTRNHKVDEEFAFLHDADPGKYALVTVEDTGSGMDETTKKRIFEPFFTTKEIGRGTGLGLASVYGIVKNHSGMITVDSEKEKGSRFRLYFPINPETAQAQSLSDHEDRDYTGTILVVDDEVMVLGITIEILEELGYRVLPVQTSKDAVEVFKKNSQSIDLVIMDIVMPDLNGFQTAKLLKEINNDVRLLYISGYPIDHERNIAVSFDHKLFLQKPFKMKELKEKIDEILSS